MRAYEAEPAYFIGHIDGPVYPEPKGDAVLTQAAHDAVAQIEQHAAGLSGAIAHAADLSIDGQVQVQQAGGEVIEQHIGVAALANSVRTDDVTEFAAGAINADGIRAYDLAVLAQVIQVEDESSTLAQLDDWAAYNGSLSSGIPPKGGPDGPMKHPDGGEEPPVPPRPPRPPHLPPPPPTHMPPPAGVPQSIQLFPRTLLGPDNTVTP